MILGTNGNSELKDEQMKHLALYQLRLHYNS